MCTVALRKTQQQQQVREMMHTTAAAAAGQNNEMKKSFAPASARARVACSLGRVHPRRTGADAAADVRAQHSWDRAITQKRGAHQRTEVNYKSFSRLIVFREDGSATRRESDKLRAQLVSTMGRDESTQNITR